MNLPSFLLSGNSKMGGCLFKSLNPFVWILKKESMRSVAKRMKGKGISAEEIAELTGLKPEEIEKL